MASIGHLQLRKAWQLKHACFLTGLPITGTKGEMASSLDLALSKPVDLSERKRIVSVDMGIKNLGLCVLESSPFYPSHFATASRTVVGQKLKVVAWKKINVLDRVIASTTADDTEDVPQTAVGKKKKPVTIGAFSPSALAEIACRLTDGWLKTYNPDTILIERQRFRSGGAAAVQEWTLRVNMLESMLWASLLTQRNEKLQEEVGRDESRKSFPALLEVIPARVANFWCSSTSAATRRVAPDLLEDGTASEADWNRLEKKKKIDKKDKIAVVRSWLAAEADESSEIQLEFTDETARVSEAFLAEARTGRRRQNTDLTAGSSGTVKLDDLADCLLQGVAWVKWVENQEKMQSLLHSALQK